MHFCFLSSCVCVCDCVGVSFSLAFFCCIFFRCVCVCWWYGCCCAVHFFCVCCCWHLGFLGWRFPLDTSLSHSRRVTRSTFLFPSVVSHHSSKLFQFESFLFSFCVNSSSTALTISFIRFVLIDFYGFCYLLLFASLCFFLFFFTIFTLLVVVFQFYLRLDFILTSFTFKCSREHFLLS